jgi:glycine/D-amino acid oxidase-like deaminating enzyme
MAKTGEHGVVLGASIAGMLAARVLSDHFDTVTIVERDVLGAAPENRRGVAQGRHLHGLLLRGAQSLDELFPGFLEELVADGAPCFDGSDLSRLYFCMNGHLGVRSGSSEDQGVQHQPPVPRVPHSPATASHAQHRDARCS